MADVAAAPSPSKAAPKKKAAAARPKKDKAPPAHPKYLEMAVTALNSLKERGGSSRQAIQKYITSNFSVGQDLKVVATHLKMALKRGVDTGAIKHVKGTGASGSFKANPVVKKKEKKPKKAKVAKKAKATKKPKKAKASPAKAKSPTKAKSPKKAAKPAKIAKASKSPAKKTAAKKASPAKVKKVAAPKKASK